MAKPSFTKNLIRDLGRDYKHDKDIGKVIEILKRRFKQERIPFAIIGAISMRFYGYVRHTEDIDIVTTSKGLDRIHAKLIGRGLVRRFSGARKSLIEPVHYVCVDVITAGEHAGSELSPIKYPDPSSKSFVMTEIGVKVPTLEKLIEFKLASGIWGSRLHDIGDVFNLIKANSLGDDFANLLHPDLRAKFLQILDAVRKEKRIE